MLRYRNSEPADSVPSYPIRVPKSATGAGAADEAFEVLLDGRWQRLRVRDHRSILRIPGLQEQLFAGFLQCLTPQRAVSLFGEVFCDWAGVPSDLRVLEVGAGNGMVAAELRQLGAGVIVGVDHRQEAIHAARRDRPGVYDDYVLGRLSGRPNASHRYLKAFAPNCLFMLAPDEHEDLNAGAFAAAWNLLQPSGWAVFSVSQGRATTARSEKFSQLIKRMSEQGCIQMECYRRYVHRHSLGGVPLCHVLFVARKNQNVSLS